MPEPQPDPYALHLPSSNPSPRLRSHKPLPRRRDDLRSILPAAVPLKEAVSSYPDDGTDSHTSSEPSSEPSSEHTPAASPAVLNGADSGLPPTPPTNSQEGIPQSEFNPPSHADGVVASLTSRQSTMSTPVNQRSPPTPDTTPPRTTASMTTPERPILFAYPSSRADSFKTAREEQFSSEAGSRSSTPLGERLSPVEEDRGLGLAFEQEDNEITPRNTIVDIHPEHDAQSHEHGKSKVAPDADELPNQEWDANLMRNVTIRKKRISKLPPSESPSAPPPASPVAASTPRRSSSLRERVEASRSSQHTPSIENFAKAIGWPTAPGDMANEQSSSVEQKRFSTSSASSAVVEAMVYVTPPQRRQTLRRSGKNLAYRRETDSPTEYDSMTHSHRGSLHSDDVPLHRLVHKRASISDRRKRVSTDSDTLGDRTVSPFSISKRSHDSTASTLAHQESVRRVLQPAADIMSRSNSVTRRLPAKNHHKRISSAPEPTVRRETASPITQTLLDQPPSDVTSPRKYRMPPSKLAQNNLAPPIISSPLNLNKSLPELPIELPIQSTNELAPPGDLTQEEDAAAPLTESEEKRPPSALLERVRHLLAEREAAQSTTAEQQQARESPAPRAPLAETTPTVRRGSLSTRGRSEERRRSMQSQDRTSTSRDTLPRHSLDRLPAEELARSSHEWHSVRADEPRRISFDRSTTRTDEHAMARHLFAQTTPFSQFSDTPIEVSEATAVSIYPHNNHSLLVVQQVSRASTLPLEHRPIIDEENFAEPLLTPPFVDASEVPHGSVENPTLTIEPSTPPTQFSLSAPGAVDSPLRNPRKPPEPPVIMFIPPTPAEELERPLVPGPPTNSDSHPQRRLSLKQRARRYSDNFITPFLARASSMRGRNASDSHATRGKPHIPTVNDEDGSLHPFWRPRGFWDGFEDSDSEGDDDVLPRGGDTSNLEDVQPDPQSQRKLGVLGRRLSNGFKNSGGFLIGNSLGVSRSGTNKRRPQISLPSRRTISEGRGNAPKILLQAPTFPIRTRSSRIEKRHSRNSLRSSASYERSARNSRSEGWRRGKAIPGLKGVQLQYIGLSGVKERLREKKAERRREALRKSIGGRWYVEPGSGTA